MPMTGPTETTTIDICVRCRAVGSADDETRAGRRLFDAVMARHAGAEGVVVRPVACLSNCNRACTAVFGAPGKVSYVYGDLTPNDSADVLRFAALYGRSADGITPWSERPERVRKGLVARVVPPDVSSLSILLDPTDPR